MKSELEALQAQYRSLRHSLFEDESEKEKLRKQIFLLKGDLMKKNNALVNIEKKFKDSNGRTQHPDGTIVVPKNAKSSSSPQKQEEMAILREKITTLEVTSAIFLYVDRDLDSNDDLSIDSLIYDYLHLHFPYSFGSQV